MTRISRAPAALLTGPTVPFHVETVGVMVRLRSALAAVVTSVVGGPLAKSRDAQRHFDVDVKLSWQLFRTLGATDPLDVVDHVPARTPFVKLLREARRRHVDPALVDEAERAYDQFEAHVARHAGDRTSFSRMLRADTDAPDPADEVPHREAAFEANRQIWGTEMDVNLHVTVLHPKAGGAGPLGRFEMVSLAALRGFRRWRTTAPVLLFKHKFPSQAATAAEADRPRPLDADTFAELGVPLVGAFCSDPRPALRTRRAGDDLVVTELAGDAVGRLNSINVTQAQFFPSVALMPVPSPKGGDAAVPAGRLGWRLARITATPTRVAVIDFIVHRPTFGSLTFGAARWGNTNAFPAALEDLDAAPDVPRLPAVDRVSYAGNAAAAVHSAGVDDYPQMLRYICDQRGWRPEELDVYRHRSEYPLLSTLDSVLFAIPGSENWPRAEAAGAAAAGGPNSEPDATSH